MTQLDTALSSPGDKIGMLQAALASVTAERDALQAKLDALELSSAAVRGAPVGIICVSGRSGRYEFINEKFAELIGRDQQQTFTADPFEVWQTVTHPEDLAAEQEAVARLARGEIDSFELDKRFVRPNGETQWVRVRAIATRDSTQRLSSMLVFFTDLQQQRALTEAKERLESQLRHTQKLEALGTLAGGVAHDFNNRLVIIMGYAEILKRALPKESPAAQPLEAILTSSQRAADLTRQLLA